MESQIRTLLWGYTEAGKYNYYIYFHDGYDDRQKMRFTAFEFREFEGKKIERVLNFCAK
jgi:hypothetical protein